MKHLSAQVSNSWVIFPHMNCHNRVPRIIAHSDNLHLCYISLSLNRPIHPGEELSSTRPELKLTSSMVPGYTGVIPKGQHYFGCRYALASRHAIDDFQRDQTHLHQQAVDMRRTADLQRDPTLRASMTSSHHTTPLMSMSQYPEPYVTDFARQHTESAFLLPPGHPDKR